MSRENREWIKDSMVWVQNHKIVSIARVYCARQGKVGDGISEVGKVYLKNALIFCVRNLYLPLFTLE